MNENNTALFVSKKMTAEPALAALAVNCPYIYAVPERVSAQGEIIYPLDEEAALVQLNEARQLGVQRALIVLLHAPRFPQHEQRLLEIARYLEFEEVQLSHRLRDLNSWQRMASLLEVQPPIKLEKPDADFFQHWLAEPEWLEHGYPLLVEVSEQSLLGYQRHFLVLQPLSLPLTEASQTLNLMVLRQSGYLERIGAVATLQINPQDCLIIQQNKT